MKLLMHICCAPCANLPIDVLRADGIDLTGYWYNPNIHPFTEYRARRNCLQAVSYTHLDVYKRQVIVHDLLRDVLQVEVRGLVHLRVCLLYTSRCV